MEKIAELFKIFFEKHLFPSVIAIAGALLSILLLPDNYWMIIRLGKTFFMILAGCVYFLGVQLLIWISKTVYSGVHQKNYFEEQHKKTEHELIDDYNTFVDSLSPQDKETLLTFVRNGNKALIACNGFRSPGSLLDNTNIINRSDFIGDISCIDKNLYWVDPSIEESYSQGLRPIGGFSQYKLKAPFFNNCTIIYKRKGNLGNF